MDFGLPIVDAHNARLRRIHIAVNTWDGPCWIVSDLAFQVQLTVAEDGEPFEWRLSDTLQDGLAFFRCSYDSDIDTLADILHAFSKNLKHKKAKVIKKKKKKKKKKN